MDMYLSGEWVSGKQREEVRSPYDGEVVGVVPVADGDDVERALDGAQRGAAFQRGLNADDRYQVLMRAASLIEQRTEQLALTISGETGKSITEARNEATRAAEIFRLSAFEGAQLYGYTLPLDAHRGAGSNSLRDAE